MVRRNGPLQQPSPSPITLKAKSGNVTGHKDSWTRRKGIMKPFFIFSVLVLVNATCVVTVFAAKLPPPTGGDVRKDGAAGNIGCLFSKTLCDPELEWCYDDFAFGRCLSTTGVIDGNDMYRYDLSKGEMHSLEKQMERLFAMGYRWSHSYTQCVLRNLLESFRRGKELDESVCLEVQDQDLEGALKAFQEDIDPWNLAFIKFNPSSKNPHSDFADESYRPPKELSPLGSGDVVTGKDLLPNEASQIRIQDRLRHPVLELSAPEAELLQEAVETYLAEPELESTVEKVKGKNSKGKNKNRKNKNKNKNKPTNIKKSMLNVEYPGQSDNFNGVDIGSAKKNPSLIGTGWTVSSSLARELPGEDPGTSVVGPDGIVNERILQPRIFSSYYNTPDSFRHGVQSWDDQALGNEIGPSDLSIMGLVGDGISSAVGGGGYENPPGYSYDDRDHRARQEELSRRQEEEDEQTREAVATLQAALLLDSLLRGENNPDGDFRNAEREELEGLPMTGQQLLPSVSKSNNLGAPYNGDLYPHGVIYSPPGLDDGNLLYTEGGLVFLNNREISNQDQILPQGDPYEEQEGLNFLKRFVSGPQVQKLDQDSWGPLELERGEDGSLISGDDDSGFGNEFPTNYGYDYSSPLFLLNRRSRNGFSFQRRERLDVKKPGPWYRTVNNYAFDKDDNQQQKMERSYVNGDGKFGNQDVNPEFGGAEGPADMIADAIQNQDPALQLEPLSRDDIESWRQKEQIGGIDKKSAPVKFDKHLPVSISDFNDGHLDLIDTSYANIFLDKSADWGAAENLVFVLADLLDLERNVFKDITTSNEIVTFKVEPNDKGWNASEVARRIQNLTGNAESETGLKIVRADVGIRANSKTPAVLALYDEQGPASNQIYIATFAVCGLVAAVLVAAVAIFLIRKHSKSREKLVRLSQDDPSFEACKDYQDLCRARMAGSKNNEKMEPIRGPVHKIASKESENGTSSSRSSTSSWSEEPVLTNMDISTGHMVLSYMEDHLKNRDRMDQEWDSLEAYEADPCSTVVAEKSENSKKNRYSNSLPFDHSRVILNDLANVSGSDFINASTITDHDPRNPAYIATQGPLPNTSADFWQMVWEQGSVVIVNLTRLTENSTALCHRYWPEEGSELHHIYEVHLVSEHIWCDEYLVRSFYLKNLKTGETRTVTQFHFLAWPENGIPQSTKALLEFRRKVNKSYRGRSCPIIVHCSDGAGRTGTYCLIDMVLNRMTKGAKEIDIAASLEHIRDQRPGVVRTKQQFEFVLMAVAEEVHAILKALPQ